MKVENATLNTLGVSPGFFPITKEESSRLSLEMSRRDSWCAPLVVAGPYEVFDFTKKYDPDRKLLHLFGLGAYDEDRVGMYEASLFKTGMERRTVHTGLDVGAPEGTPVFSPCDAEVIGAAHLSEPGDYGGTVILKTKTEPELFMLFGHLSKSTSERWAVGAAVVGGELLGWLGGRAENGGWNPHLHWQLSWLRPLKVDLPGAVLKRDRELAMAVFPDPTPILKSCLGGLSP